MIKSSAPVFVVLFAFFFKLEEPSFHIFITIGIICVGVLVMVGAEAQELHFDLGGYLQVQTAAIFSGLRWSLTNILLLRKSMGMTHPVVTAYYLAPLVSISLFVAHLIVEGPGLLLSSRFFISPVLGLHMIGIISIGGFIGYLLALMEFKLISSTSVVTFTVAGIVKEIFTIIASQWIYKDKISSMEVVGLIISILGISLYNYFKIFKGEKSHGRDINELSDLGNSYEKIDIEDD